MDKPKLKPSERIKIVLDFIECLDSLTRIENPTLGGCLKILTEIRILANETIERYKIKT